MTTKHKPATPLPWAAAALAAYGAGLSDEGFIVKGKPLTVKLVLKRERLLFLGFDGHVLASGPAIPKTVENFVERFWFWRKQT